MENKKKRAVLTTIDKKNGQAFRNYADEFDYLINAGIALNVQAISNSQFPLIETAGKNLLKLYLNDVGIVNKALTWGLYMKLLLPQSLLHMGINCSIMTTEVRER